jgi:hypothetical protein
LAWMAEVGGKKWGKEVMIEVLDSGVVMLM